MKTKLSVASVYPNNKILTSYLDQSENLKPFYSGHPTNKNDWQTVINQRANFSHDMRNQVAEILLHQSKTTHPLVTANIEKLKHNNTFALVTGQQAGFFGGPLFTFFKTLSTIKWAEHLKKEFPAYNFVPVFWVEIEDHDFQEIARFSNPEHPPVSYTDPDSDTYQQIVHRTIKTDFSTFLGQVFSLLPESEFKKSYTEIIAECYAEGMGFGDAFKKFMHVIFDDFGLIICDPTDVRLKRLANPVFEKEILNLTSEQSISSQSEKLTAAGFSPQVTPRQINSFFIDGGKRLGILKQENVYSLQGKEQIFSEKEMTILIRQHPEKFSPNVVLRPLYQDYILPTIGISAGPGELSYFMQFKSNYEAFGVPLPILIPRAFGIIIEPAIERLLEKLSIDILDVLTEQNLTHQYLTQKRGIDTQTEMADLKKAIEQLMQSKTEIIRSTDSTLVDTWNSQIGKTLIGIDQFEQRLDKSIKRNEEQTINQIKRILQHLMPENHPQERTHSILYYLTKYGSTVVRSLYDQIEPSFDFHLLKPLK